MEWLTSLKYKKDVGGGVCANADETWPSNFPASRDVSVLVASRQNILFSRRERDQQLEEEAMNWDRHKQQAKGNQERRLRTDAMGF